MSLQGRRLRGNLLNIGVGQAINDDGREDLLKTPDHVALHDLSGDICDEYLEQDLDKRPSAKEWKAMSMANLIDSKGTIKGFFAADIFHIGVNALGVGFYSSIDIDTSRCMG